ncbi:hypothetical protein NDU88_005857 [Pleurodeles waltl]|uniref:Uncharacterized protein n=1 Tax=Pleurodeles waltl TaxID=8319 RepID=A0AAV7WAR7_PLEWA|nr:hypothetical protein NDU88_005857 [Pleurodeles waltl]
MSAETKISQAMHFLEEAGRLDLLAEGVCVVVRPSRRAAAGITAAVYACFPSSPGVNKRQLKVASNFPGQTRHIHSAARTKSGYVAAPQSPPVAAGPLQAGVYCADDEQPGPSRAMSSVCSGHTVLDYDAMEEGSLEEGEVHEEEAPQALEEVAWGV